MAAAPLAGAPDDCLGVGDEVAKRGVVAEVADKDQTTLSVRSDQGRLSDRLAVSRGQRGPAQASFASSSLVG